MGDGDQHEDHNQRQPEEAPVVLRLLRLPHHQPSIHPSIPALSTTIYSPSRLSSPHTPHSEPRLRCHSRQHLQALLPAAAISHSRCSPSRPPIQGRSSPAPAPAPAPARRPHQSRHTSDYAHPHPKTHTDDIIISSSPSSIISSASLSSGLFGGRPSQHLSNQPQFYRRMQQTTTHWTATPPYVGLRSAQI